MEQHAGNLGDMALAGKGNGRRGRRWRIAAWGTAAALLLLPLIAMQFTEEVNWTVGDFVFAGVLLFGSLGAYELAASASGSRVYRAGAGVAIVAALLLTWVNAAVGLTDSAADGLYLGVVAIAILGGLAVRFRAVGMVWVMLTAAIAQVLIGVGALVMGLVPDFNPPAEILGLTAFFAALWLVSAWLFRAAARGVTRAD